MTNDKRDSGDIFNEALQIAPAERGKFLDTACSGEPNLRVEIEELLEFHEQTPEFLEASPPLVHDLSEVEAQVRYENKEKSIGTLADVEPRDLLGYGLIPEFVGRLPIIATLDELDQNDLVRVLTEPKNALVKQYQQLFQLNNVILRFTEGAMTEIARKAQEKKTGARGLRSIIEDAMLDTMYDIPSKNDVKEVVVSEKVITKGEQPMIVYESAVQAG